MLIGIGNEVWMLNCAIFRAHGRFSMHVMFKKHNFPHFTDNFFEFKGNFSLVFCLALEFHHVVFGKWNFPKLTQFAKLKFGIFVFSQETRRKSVTWKCTQSNRIQFQPNPNRFRLFPVNLSQIRMKGFMLTPKQAPLK